MPMYDYECKVCKERVQLINSIANHSKGGECCGSERKQIILSAPMIDDYFLGSTKNEGYHCVVTDKWINSKRARKNMIAEHNVIPKD